MFRKIVLHRLPQGFLLLLFCALLVNPLPRSSRSVLQFSTTELACSGVDSLPGNCSPTILETEDAPDILPTAGSEITFLSPVGLPVQHSPGWLHFWGRGSYFAYLIRPPPFPEYS